ncbi:hypothetical protein, partial [Klebsiella aerogenes]|uniref:hypothetical protein n=1 Tax=Klebsiella aerogenes TaxID=548 RepID=UPI0019533D22
SFDSSIALAMGSGIVQDMMFIHQRIKAISLIGASQGLIVVSLGIGSPMIVAHQGWRFLYLE